VRDITAAIVVLCIVALGFYLSIKEQDRIERITGERPTMVDVLSP
jgi:hypothetical protein